MLMETNVKTRDYIISKLEQKYPQMNCRTTEEFDGQSGGIWISAEDGIEDRKGNLLFNQWSDSSSYNCGVVYHLNRWANRNGWWFEWYDGGTMMIWPEV